MALENDKEATGAPANGGNGDGTGTSKERRRKRRWGEVKQQTPTSAAVSDSAAAAASTTTTTTSSAASNRVLALKESIRARLAAAKAKQAGLSTAAGAPTAASSYIGTTATTTTTVATQETERPSKRAKQYELDLSVTAPTFSPSSQAFSATEGRERKIAPKKKKKKSDNPYLAHLEGPDEPEDDEKDNDTAAAADTTTPAADEDFVDERLQRVSKPRTRHKEFKFVQAGHWQKVAAAKREKAAAAAAAGYASGRKTGHTIQSISMGGGGGADTYGPSSARDVLMDSTQIMSPSQLAPRADAHTDTNMPLCMEWWDVEFLPSKLKKQVAATESQALSQKTKAALKLQLLEDQKKEETSTEGKAGSGGGDMDQAAEEPANKDDDDENKAISASSLSDLKTRCWEQAALRYSKTATLVQHIVPVRPPNADTGPAKQPVLHLTKEELRRQRKLRRQQKQRELQDLQAAGLIPAPEPRLTLSNFIQVLGDQAFVDPSQMEQKVLDQIQARQKAHLDRNQANKLTKEQRSAKRARKLQEDTSTGVTVALFYVKDASHPYHRALLDLNAQQNSLTGGVLEVPSIGVSCVIVEGGPKAIERYKRLLLVRMKWTGPPNDEDDDDDDVNQDQGATSDTGDYKTQKFNPDNQCQLVWQGMAVKALFQGFVFQFCETSAQARKILKNKGVEHYWDQVLRHASGQDQGLQLKLTSIGDNNGIDNDEDDNPYHQQDDGDIVMRE